jgi:hypothetical protein
VVSAKRFNGDVRDLIGDPKQVARELRGFQKTAQVLSSRYPRLVERYPRQWVAVHDGTVKAHAKTLDALLKQVDRKRLPRGQIIVRYIDKTQRTMIL